MIRALRFRNFGPFRGEHFIELQPICYAMTARRDTDPTRSNWSGKSMVMEAIDFVIYGRLNPVRRFDADGWITRGENEGEVALYHEQGSVTRSRTRGKPTQIRYESNGLKAAQQEAQAAILEWIRLTEDDFRSSSYFEQKEMARFVRARPEDRMETVSGWFQLHRIEDAEKLARDESSAHVREIQKHQMRKQTLTELLANIPSDLDKTIETLTEEVDTIDAEIHDLTSRRDAVRAVKAAKQTVEDYEKVVERGKKLKDEAEAPELENVFKNAEVAEKMITELSSKHAEAQRVTAQRKKVSLGQFDGNCPVSPGFACPAKAVINTDRERTKSALQEAEASERAFLGALEQTKKEKEHVLRAKKEIERKRIELAQLRDHAEALRERRNEAKRILKKAEDEDGNALYEQITKARETKDKIVGDLATARAGKKRGDDLRSELARLEKTIEEEQRAQGLASAAAAVFKATHRRIAEVSLASIGEAANLGLEAAGAALRVDIRWEREGKEPARVCEACGAAFPSSAKVKQCEFCKADRGKNTIQKLEFALSDRSGAADDLVGIAFQLAAGSWILGARHSPWSTAMIDEPFGALDAHHRRSLAKHLAAMLSTRYSYRQALIIAHDTASLDAFPGRIEIIASKNGSTIRVV